MPRDATRMGQGSGLNFLGSILEEVIGGRMSLDSRLMALSVPSVMILNAKKVLRLGYLTPKNVRKDCENSV